MWWWCWCVLSIKYQWSTSKRLLLFFEQLAGSREHVAYLMVMVEAGSRHFSSASRLTIWKLLEGLLIELESWFLPGLDKYRFSSKKNTSETFIFFMFWQGKRVRFPSIYHCTYLTLPHPAQKASSYGLLPLDFLEENILILRMRACCVGMLVS